MIKCATKDSEMKVSMEGNLPSLLHEAEAICVCMFEKLKEDEDLNLPGDACKNLFDFFVENVKEKVFGNEEVESTETFNTDDLRDVLNDLFKAMR